MQVLVLQRCCLVMCPASGPTIELLLVVNKVVKCLERERSRIIIRIRIIS